LNSIKKRPSQILVGTPEICFDEEGNFIGLQEKNLNQAAQNLAKQLSMQFQDLQATFFARIVQKVGSRRYWEKWAKSVAEIAQNQIEKITTLINANSECQATFANALKRSLPRLILVDTIEDFWAFSQAGKELAYLHLNYEKVPPHPQVKVKGEESGDYTVKKMRFAAQKDKIIYNSSITISNIPAKAYEYVVNGKSAIE
jgi:predicted helicase